MAEFLAGLDENALLALPWMFEFWALPHQLPPDGAWKTWVVMGGRGAGKSWIGAYKFFRKVKPGRLYSILAPTYPLLRDTTFRSFQSMARLLRRPYRINKTDGIDPRLRFNV